jgi:hypothetical protein
MGADVIRFEVFCPACKKALHDRCWQYLGELFGWPFTPCPCGCRDEFGDLTHLALTDMMKRQPDVLARMIRFDAAFERGSYRIHAEGKRYGNPF